MDKKKKIKIAIITTSCVVVAVFCVYLCFINKNGRVNTKNNPSDQENNIVTNNDNIKTNDNGRNININPKESLVKNAVSNNRIDGDTIELDYSTNGGVPYFWEYEIEDESIIKFVEEKEKENNNKNGMVGAPIVKTYVFKGIKTGKTSINFKYIHVGSKDIAQDETVYLEVDEDNNLRLISRIDNLNNERLEDSVVSTDDILNDKNLDLTAEYKSEDDENYMKITKTDSGYNVEISVYRLAHFEGTITDITEKKDMIVITSTDPNGEYIRFLFNYNNNILTVTDTIWPLLSNGESFRLNKTK